MTNLTIPTLDSIADLTAIIDFQAPVMPDTDIALLPNDVYMYGPDVAFCVVWGGRLDVVDLPAGPAYARFAELCAVANEAIPFDGFYSELESEE